MKDYIHATKDCMHSKITCIKKIHTFKDYKHSKNIHFQRLHTLIDYTHSKITNIQILHAFKDYIQSKVIYKTLVTSSSCKQKKTTDIHLSLQLKDYSVMGCFLSVFGI